MLDLNSKYLKMIKVILSHHVPEMEVWAYGSRVNGDSHDGSDLDLVVINPRDKTILQKKLAELREAFSESNIPILIDIHDWAEIPEKFQQEIARNYVVIQPG